MIKQTRCQTAKSGSCSRPSIHMHALHSTPHLGRPGAQVCSSAASRWVKTGTPGACRLAPVARKTARTQLVAAAVPQPAEASASGAPSTQQEGTDLTASWALLKEFSLKEFKGLGASYLATPKKRDQLRAALKTAFEHPWPAAGWVPGPFPHGLSPQAGDGSPPVQPAEPPSQAPAGVSGSSRVGSNLPEQQASQGQAQQQPLAPEVLIGVVASDVRIGVRAFRDWCWGLGLPYIKPQSRVNGVEQLAAIRGGVYIKYNSRTQLCYISQYVGKDRGVLIQLGQEQLGHFPLGMWDEGMKNPPPHL